MKMISVLFVSHSAELYGAERCLLDIISRMNRCVFRMYLLCPKKGTLSDTASAMGITVLITPYKYWLARKAFAPRHIGYLAINLLSVLRIRRLIKVHSIDIVYTNTCTILSGALASKSMNKPHIWHIHESIGLESDAFRLGFVYKPVFAIIAALSDKIIVNSEAIKAIFPAKHNHKQVVVYNSFALDDFTSNVADRNTLRAQYKIPADSKVISIIGSISERKGQLKVIKAMPNILQSVPQAVLVIAGMSSIEHEEYEQEIHRLLRDYGLENSALMVGFKQEIADIYRISDVLVVPSRDEAFGRVIVESMLFGVPVIASRVGGIPEIISHGENGVLLDSREPECIARAVINLLEDPELAARYAREGMRSATSRFDIRSAIKNVETILATTITGAKAG